MGLCTEGVGNAVSSSVGVARVFVWVKTSDFSTFSRFWVKTVFFNRVSRAVGMMDGADEFKTV